MAPGVPTTLHFLMGPGTSCSYHPPTPASTLAPLSLGISRESGHRSQQGRGQMSDLRRASSCTVCSLGELSTELGLPGIGGP